MEFFNKWRPSAKIGEDVKNPLVEVDGANTNELTPADEKYLQHDQQVHAIDIVKLSTSSGYKSLLGKLNADQTHKTTNSILALLACTALGNDLDKTVLPNITTGMSNTTDTNVTAFIKNSIQNLKIVESEIDKK
jgi:hypothetical protein